MLDKSLQFFALFTSCFAYSFCFIYLKKGFLKFWKGYGNIFSMAEMVTWIKKKNPMS